MHSQGETNRGFPRGKNYPAFIVIDAVTGGQELHERAHPGFEEEDLAKIFRRDKKLRSPEKNRRVVIGSFDVFICINLFR
jgi:hypothetical protein